MIQADEIRQMIRLLAQPSIMNNEVLWREVVGELSATFRSHGVTERRIRNAVAMFDLPDEVVSLLV